MSQMRVNSEKYENIDIYTDRELLNLLEKLGESGNGFITFEVGDDFIQSSGDRQSGFSLEKKVGNIIYQAERQDFSLAELCEFYRDYYHQSRDWDKGVAWTEFLDVSEPLETAGFLASPYYKLLYRVLVVAFLLYFFSHFIDYNKVLSYFSG